MNSIVNDYRTEEGEHPIQKHDRNYEIPFLWEVDVAQTCN